MNGPEHATRFQPYQSRALFCMLCRRQGQPGLPSPGIFVHSCMPHGIPHPDGETDRRSRHRVKRREPGQDDPDAAGSSIWAPGRGWTPVWVIRRTAIRQIPNRMLLHTQGCLRSV
jgi:hypothetical protein